MDLGRRAGKCVRARTIAHPQVVRERLGGELDLGPLLGVVVDGQAREEIAELGGGAKGVGRRAVHGVACAERTGGCSWRQTGAHQVGDVSVVVLQMRLATVRGHTHAFCARG